MKEKKFISLVVYLHNVEDYIKYFMKSIIPVCESNFEQFEIVCVDDGQRWIHYARLGLGFSY